MDSSNKYIDVTSIKEMLFDEKKYVLEFVDATRQSFEEFISNYSTYLLQRDATNFRKTGHKIKPVAQMLKIDDVIKEYEKAKMLLWNDEKQEELEQSVERMEQICEIVFKELENVKQEYEQ